MNKLHSNPSYGLSYKFVLSYQKVPKGKWLVSDCVIKDIL